MVRGHKMTLELIAHGQNMITYSLPIGHALVDIAEGESIHSQNIKTNLNEINKHQYQPKLTKYPAQAADPDESLP